MVSNTELPSEVVKSVIAKEEAYYSVVTLDELMTDKEKFITKVDIHSHLLIELKEHICGSKKATSQEVRKSKENGGSIDSFDSFEKNSKNDYLTSSLYVSSYFETDLKAKEISTIINNIDKSDNTFISLNKTKKKPNKKDE